MNQNLITKDFIDEFCKKFYKKNITLNRLKKLIKSKGFGAADNTFHAGGVWNVLKIEGDKLFWYAQNINHEEYFLVNKINIINIGKNIYFHDETGFYVFEERKKRLEICYYAYCLEQPKKIHETYFFLKEKGFKIIYRNMEFDKNLLLKDCYYNLFTGEKEVVEDTDKLFFWQKFPKK